MTTLVDRTPTLDTDLLAEQTTVEFWIDPSCPFCWATARWLVDEVAPHRDLDVQWRPISLLLKNQPTPGSRYHEMAAHTHGMLRVMESVRSQYGNDGVSRLYWELGARIHHDRDRHFTATEALASAGLDVGHAAAYDDESWDLVIREGMDDGLSLVGDDVGTPIIAVTNSRGERVAYFGPVITKVPSTADSLRMWDALTTMMDIDGFFELKRTRTESPDPGPRPLS